MILKAGVDETGVAQFVSMDIFSDSGFSFYDDTSYLAELHARVKTKPIIKLKLIISWLYFLLYYNVPSPTHMFEFWQKKSWISHTPKFKVHAY